MKLQRHPANPILLPDPASDWETYNVFNPAVSYHNGLFHMHYRAQGLDWISRIGYAVSEDGIRWNRLRRPVLEPANESEARGVEDPRVTELEGGFYMAYTAYASSPIGSFNITPMFARSRNLISWERIGPLVRGEDNKDHALFPRRIHGRYVSLHRRPPRVWLAESDDLVAWSEALMRPVFGPREDNRWDCKRVGGNGVPIETPHGWLVFYHAYDQQHVYRLGVCLLDLDDPGRVLHRPLEPIFEPEELWELRGDVPNVVFSCANIVVNGRVYVYYGAADHVIGLATCDFDELLEYARFG
ncbi:MAG: glycosidase [Chloroflexi bacterium]|nr:glycosidase [Chloroflexota bacterium]